MKRRTLDLILVAGGLVLAILLAVLGLAVGSQASFATDYVAGELGAQKITFTEASKLSPEETSWKAGSSCLVIYGGQLLQTGKQAECYAKYYIAKHMDAAATNAGFPGATYATLGAISSDLRTQVSAAKAKGDTTAAADLQKKVDSATALRSTMQTGETLRGLLLTTYGFSVMGDLAGQAANIVYGLAAMMLLLSGAGFVHSFVTPKEKILFAPVGGVQKIPTPA